MKKTKDDIARSKNQQRNASITVKKTMGDTVKAMSVHTSPKEVNKVAEPDVFHKTVVASPKKQTPFGRPKKRVIIREEYEVQVRKRTTAVQPMMTTVHKITPLRNIVTPPQQFRSTAIKYDHKRSSTTILSPMRKQKFTFQEETRIRDQERRSSIDVNFKGHVVRVLPLIATRETAAG